MLVLISGCGDATLPTTPTPVQRVEGEGQLLGGLLDNLTSILVKPLHRSRPLSDPVSWSFTVGSSGATSSNSQTGLTITVPRGALSQTVTITVTALEGSAVAYRFEPHGLQFARPVQLKQSLSGLDGGLLNRLLLLGGHFPGSEPIYVSGLALVDETVSASLNLLGGSFTVPITHFSGWIMASGRSGSRDSDASY